MSPFSQVFCVSVVNSSQVFYTPETPPTASEQIKRSVYFGSPACVRPAPLLFTGPSPRPGPPRLPENSPPPWTPFLSLLSGATGVSFVVIVLFLFFCSHVFLAHFFTNLLADHPITFRERAPSRQNFWDSARLIRQEQNFEVVLQMNSPQDLVNVSGLHSLFWNLLFQHRFTSTLPGQFRASRRHLRGGAGSFSSGISLLPCGPFLWILSFKSLHRKLQFPKYTTPRLTHHSPYSRQCLLTS